MRHTVTGSFVAASADRLGGFGVDQRLEQMCIRDRAELYVVTTPQPAAQKVAQRAAFMAEKVRLDVKGVIENMSWFTGDDGTRYEIFGAGGGQELAETIDVPLLGRIPLVPKLREGGDDGHPIMAVDPESEAAQAFAAIAERVDVELAPTRRYNPELTII